MSNIKEYKCPCCAGTLEFDVSSQKVVCPYCGTEFDEESIKGIEEESKITSKSNETWDVEEKETMTDIDGKAITAYSCDNCGGEIICDENTTATECPYCGNPVLIQSKLKGTLKPDYIIPFKKNKDDAMAGLKKFMKGKLLLVPSFKKESRLEEIKGMYAPYWLFDAQVYGHCVYKATKVRHYVSGDYDVTETRHYSIVRDGDIAFDKIPVDGSSKMEDSKMESIEPFVFKEATEFNGMYMSGHYAEKYDVEQKDAFPRANERIKEGTASAFQSTIHGYSSVTVNTVTIDLQDTAAHYAMYPVWFLNMKHKGKLYPFLVNGQTGKANGNLPLSAPLTIMWAAIWVLLPTIPTLIYSLTNPNVEEPAVNIIVAAVIGAVIATIWDVLFARQLKGFKKKYGAKDYQVPGSMNITKSSDIYLYRTVSRTRRSSSTTKR